MIKIYKTNRKGLVPNEYIYIKDVPKVFTGDGFLFNVSFDWDTDSGTFLKTSSNFGAPEIGDLVDQRMSSGKVLRSVVTSCTQDWDIGKGELHILCYVEDYNKLISCNKVV